LEASFFLFESSFSRVKMCSESEYDISFNRWMILFSENVESKASFFDVFRQILIFEPYLTDSSTKRKNFQKSDIYFCSPSKDESNGIQHNFFQPP